jgi:hypothetical protein
VLPHTGLINSEQQPRLRRWFVLVLAVSLVSGLLVMVGRSWAAVTVSFGKSALFDGTIKIYSKGSSE